MNEVHLSPEDERLTDELHELSALLLTHESRVKHALEHGLQAHPLVAHLSVATVQAAVHAAIQDVHRMAALLHHAKHLRDQGTP